MTQPDSHHNTGFDLPSLEIKIGDALQLQEMDNPEQARHYIKLIGFLNHKSVVVSLAESERLIPSVSENQVVQIRGFANRHMYEFNSKIISVYHTPYPHLHLEYPKQLNVITMRGALRIRLNLHSSVQILSRQMKSPAVIEDLSTSGAKISAKQILADVDKELAISFHLNVDGEEQLYNVTAIVRNIRTDNINNAGESYVSHGIEFIHMEAKQRTKLQNFICKCIVEGQKKEPSPEEAAQPAA